MNQDSFHLLAYNSALVTGSTDAQVAAVAEQQYNRSNNSFQMPDPALLYLAYAQGTGAKTARINTGSMLPRGLPHIKPVVIGVVPNSPTGIMDFRDNPLSLRKEEDLRVDVTHTDAGTQNQTVGLWIAKTPLNFNVNARDLRWIRFTATPTETAFTWCAPVSITFQDTLEGGVYDIYGLDVSSANTIFARLVLQGFWNRPGVTARGTPGGLGTNIFSGGMGWFGRFNTYSVPQIETLANTAGAATLEGELLVAKAA